MLVNGTLPNVALKAIGEGTGASFGDIQWILSGYTLCLASLQLTAGNLADLFGRRRLLLIGLGLFTGASVIAVLATSPLTLILARILQGIGAATLFPASLAVLANAFTGRERGRAIGIRGVVVGVAYGLGSLVGGVAVALLGWRGIFVALALVGIPTIVLALRSVEESRDPDPDPVDVPGVLSLTAGLGLVVFGVLRGNPAGWDSLQVLGSLAAGVVVLILFVVIERRVAKPMIDLGDFAIPTYAGVSIVTALTGASVIAVLAYVTLDLLVVAEGSPIEVGLWLTPLLAVAAGASLTARYARSASLGVGLAVSMALCAGGLLLLRGTTAASEWTHFVPGLLVVGLGLGLAQPLGALAHLGVLAPARDGVASGMNNTSRQIGITLGLAGLGALLENRLTGSLTGVAEPLREQLGSSNLGTVLAAQPEADRPALRALYESAFSGALNDVLLAAAALAALAAIVALLTIRERDFRAI